MSQDLTEYNKKYKQLTTASEKKNEAMMMLVGRVDWGEFIYPAPTSINLLGNLMIIACSTDFRLVEEGKDKNYKLMRYPESFRASLVQLVNEGWKAFNTAQNNMDKIYLMTSTTIPPNIVDATKLLLAGDLYDIKEVVPIKLKAVMDAANECKDLAADVDKSFVDVMNLIGEIMEACTLSKGTHEEQKKATEVKLQVLDVLKQQQQEDKEFWDKQYEEGSKAVEEQQKAVKKALDSIPSGFEVLAMNLVESVVDMGLGLAKSFVAMKTGGMVNAGPAPNKTQSISNEEQDKKRKKKEKTSEPAFSKASAIHSNIQILDQRFDKDGKLIDDPKQAEKARYALDMLGMVGKSLEESSTKSSAGLEAIKLCQEGVALANKILTLTSSINETDVSQVYSTANQLTTESMSFLTKANLELRNVPANASLPSFPPLPSGGSSAQQATANARLKAEVAQQTLDVQKQELKEAQEKKLESSKKLAELMSQMKEMDLKNIHFAQILDVLKKGIFALSALREQWAKLVNFFQSLCNIIQITLYKQLKGFVDDATAGQKKSIVTGMNVSSVLRDTIISSASSASQITFVVQSLTDLYVKVSKKYLTTPLASLNKLCHFDPQTEADQIQAARKELDDNLKEAHEMISNEVQEHLSATEKNIEKRMLALEELKTLLPPDPKLDKIIKDVTTAAKEEHIKKIEEEKEPSWEDFV